jgi:serine protease Do
MRRLTWLLFSLFVVLAAATFQLRPLPLIAETQFFHANQSIPAIVAPEGRLATIFESARPATLRIEARIPGSGSRGPVGVGTGFFISEDGLILTANHVVDPSDIGNSAIRQNVRYVAIDPDRNEYPVQLVGFDAYLDLAVMQAEILGPVPYLPLASLNPRVGNEVVAIGNSNGDFLEGRVGRISRLGVASPRARFADNTIELTAALSPGDSGGPVLNANGEAIGVVSYISFNPGGTAMNVPPHLRGLVLSQYASFAVPVSMDSEIVRGLIAGDRRDFPVIGFRAVPGDYDPLQSNVYLGRERGVVIQQVEPNSPAGSAGLRNLQGSGTDILADVIIAIDDEPTPTFNDLLAVINSKGVGAIVTVTVQRGTETIRVRLELAARQEVFR